MLAGSMELSWLLIHSKAYCSLQNPTHNIQKSAKVKKKGGGFTFVSFQTSESFKIFTERAKNGPSPFLP